MQLSFIRKIDDPGLLTHMSPCPTGTKTNSSPLQSELLLASSEQSLDGKLFVEFVALIYLHYIKKQMQMSDLFKKYTIQGALDKLDVIECFEAPGQQLRVGELLEKQKEIYCALGIDLPASL